MTAESKKLRSLRVCAGRAHVGLPTRMTVLTTATISFWFSSWAPLAPRPNVSDHTSF